LKSVTELKRNFPDKIILADMKTMDTGYLETEIAGKAGANIVSILAAADDDTIKDSVKAAKKLGIKICCDLINIKNPIKRAKELQKLSVNYISLHLGIDQQRKTKYPYQTLKKLCKSVKIPVSAAGGLTDKNVKDVINAGAEIIIVGSFITKAKDPTKATKAIIKKM